MSTQPHTSSNFKFSFQCNTLKPFSMYTNEQTSNHCFQAKCASGPQVLELAIKNSYRIIENKRKCYWKWLILSLKSEREREMAYTFNQKRVPEFFIVYLPEHSSESLLIPDSFVSFCNRLLPKNAVLSNHLGSLWHVIVDYIGGKVFFLNGWKKFVKDNSIESGDLLIFRYNGQCGFGVKVFGQDACEKIENKANGTSYMNKVKLEDNEEEKQKEEAKENDNEDEDCDDHDGDDNMDSDYEEEKQKEEEPKENDNDEEDCDDHDSYDNDDSDYLDYIGEQEEEDSYMNKVELEKDEVEQEKDKETKENDNDHEDCDDHDSHDSDYEDYIGEQEKEEDSYMNKVKLEKGEVEKEQDEETKENDYEDGDCDDHDSDDSDYKDYIGLQEEEEDSTKEEEAFKNSKAGKKSVGNIGGSKKTAAVKVEPGSTRTNPINIEEEEESTVGKSRDRKQGCSNNGVFQQMPVHKIGKGYKRTNDVLLEEVDVPKIIQPQNPHFIAKLKAGSTRNLLLIPVTVLKLYQLKLQNLIFFRNKRGMHWPGEVINRRNNQIYIRGWNDFCRANHVSMDDSCICEFPQGSNQEVNVIEVNIVCNTGEGASRKQRVHNKNG